MGEEQTKSLDVKNGFLPLSDKQRYPIISALANLSIDDLSRIEWSNVDWSSLLNELTTRGRQGLFEGDSDLLRKLLTATQNNLVAYGTVCLLIAIEYQRRGENFNARTFLNIYNEIQAKTKNAELMPDASLIALLYTGKVYSQDLSIPPEKAYKVLRRWEEVSKIKPNQRELLRAYWRISVNSALQGDNLVARLYLQKHASVARELNSINQLANSYMIRSYLDSLNDEKPLKIGDDAAWGIKYYLDAQSTRSLPQMLLIDGGMELKFSRHRPSAYAKLLLAKLLIPILEMRTATEGISEALRVLAQANPFATLVFFHAIGLMEKYKPGDLSTNLNSDEYLLLREIGDSVRILRAGWKWANDIARDLRKTGDLSSIIRILYAEGMLSGGSF
ncbi:MAG: hypothetical protein IH595_03665 [Bacteroidales bacterium]|nr:hypothetical protein [Bacteroidales bacterium]